MENQNNENQINIELSEEVAEGIFSNLAICRIMLYVDHLDQNSLKSPSVHNLHPECSEP